MSIAETLLPEFDQEMDSTRRVLERVPTEKGTWKPHPKSFSLGHLSQLVSGMPGWITNAVTQTSLNLAEYPGYSYEKTEDLLKTFAKHVKEARQVIASAKDSDFTIPWSLRRGDQIFFTAPRGVIVRQTINHLVHHRGQLTVYLRLIDVPVPSIYGPPADEPRPGLSPAKGGMRDEGRGMGDADACCSCSSPIPHPY
ncbi:MAG: DinB family protein, partial [Gemmatimonadaceae bacterium]